jgi:hypothetical protein
MSEVGPSSDKTTSWKAENVRSRLEFGQNNKLEG